MSEPVRCGKCGGFVYVTGETFCCACSAPPPSEVAAPPSAVANYERFIEEVHRKDSRAYRDEIGYAVDLIANGDFTGDASGNFFTDVTALRAAAILLWRQESSSAPPPSGWSETHRETLEVLADRLEHAQADSPEQYLCITRAAAEAIRAALAALARRAAPTEETEK